MPLKVKRRRNAILQAYELNVPPKLKCTYMAEIETESLLYASYI